MWSCSTNTVRLQPWVFLFTRRPLSSPSTQLLSTSKTSWGEMRPRPSLQRWSPRQIYRHPIHPSPVWSLRTGPPSMNRHRSTLRSLTTLRSPPRMPPGLSLIPCIHSSGLWGTILWSDTTRLVSSTHINLLLVWMVFLLKFVKDTLMLTTAVRL